MDASLNRPALPGTPPHARLPFAARVGERLLEQVLAAQRQGSLQQLLQRRPRVTRWGLRRFAAPVLRAGGEALAGDAAQPAALRCLLHWGLSQLRPDAAPFEAPIDRRAWLDPGAWRPLLALACHYEFLPVPDFRDRYLARADEPPAEHLCGLWDIAPSSFYRHLDKGRRQLADILLEQPLPSERWLSLGLAAQAEACRRAGLHDEDERRAWHARQAELALQQGQVLSALWHRLQRRDVQGVTAVLRQQASALAREPMTERLLQLLPSGGLDTRPHVRLLLARAGLARLRGASEQEQRLCEQALRLAAEESDALMTGIAYAALGKFHESREADTSFACFQESASFLERAQHEGPAADAGVDSPADAAAELHAARLTTRVQLAWLYTLRNDPRAGAMLEQAEALRGSATELPDEAAAMLEQARSEFWRRSADYARALEAAHRALQIYQRAGNLPKLLRVYGNLALLYGHVQEVDRSIEYSRRVIELARTTGVDPETLASTHVNLGLALVWQKHYDDGIAQYRLALEHAQGARLRVVAGRAHYNLAEALYLRYLQGRDAEDERLGDFHVQAALEAWPPDADPGAADATRRLKSEVLGQGEAGVYDRLLPAETAAHFEAMREVQRQRERLAGPLPTEARIEAHLAIAAAHLGIVIEEREAAQALMREHGLVERCGTQVEALHERFDRGLARDRRVAADWARVVPQLLGEARAGQVLQHLLAGGRLSKSAYAELCRVSLGTASRHLGLLAERGLLQQSGRGPATHYRLPD